MVLDDLKEPIVLAPLAGGPSTPKLAAEVCEAGGLGFLAAGYLSADGLADGIRELRTLTARPFGVNLFLSPPHPADPAAYAGHVEQIRTWASARGLPVGQPRFDDDAYAAKLELLLHDPVAVVSFTFGMPAAGAVRRLHDAGSEVWVTVTTAAEAAAAAGAGADVLVLQGSEAGGHRGSFEDDDGPGVALSALIASVRGSGPPLVAAGGLMSGAGIAAVLAAGARAAQLGTAFLLCPEAGTTEPHRAALRAAGAPTAQTRAYTGRTARGIVNEFMTAIDASAVSAYPEIHHVTQPLRQAARAAGDASAINLWAGESYPQIRELPAAELVRLLAGELDAHR
jgi:nitronate monooxygenase